MSTTTPPVSDAGRAIVTRMREHNDAPKWNRVVDDRLWPTDLERVAEFRDELGERRGARRETIPGALVEWIMRRRLNVPWFTHALRGIADVEQDWPRVPTMSRAELAHRPWDLVASDADLDTMIIYRTSGTTGHIVQVPYDPLAAAKNVPLIETALLHHGIAASRITDAQVACFLVGAQQHTVTYPAFLRAWNDAGFCKLNLRASEWPRAESVHRYFADHAPALLTGDPISFAEYLRLGIAHRPVAALSTAVAMSKALSRRLATSLQCPLIDWYSLTETGPLAFQCTRGEFHQLPHDVYLEVLRSDGSIASPGERGEITVTGGRNPFVPLLRYRTGDFGYLDFKTCECGDPMPRLLELEGRPPVLFRSASGEPVNPVDVSRVLREYALVNHELVQRADGACELVVRLVDDARGFFNDEKLRVELLALFGDLPLTIAQDPTLGDKQPGKIVPYRTELPLDE